MARFSYKQVTAATVPLTNWSKFAVHPIADRLLWVLVNFTRIHPNVLTGLSFVLGIGTCLAFARGDRVGFVTGAILFYSSFGIDTIDGAFARLTSRTSKLGAFLDILTDYCRSALASVGLVIGICSTTSDVRILALACSFIAVTLAYYQLGEISTRLAGERAGRLLERSPGRLASHIATIRRLGFIPTPFGIADYEAVAFVLGPLLGYPVEGMLFALVIGAATRLVALAFVMRRFLNAGT